MDSHLYGQSQKPSTHDVMGYTGPSSRARLLPLDFRVRRCHDIDLMPVSQRCDISATRPVSWSAPPRFHSVVCEPNALAST